MKIAPMVLIMFIIVTNVSGKSIRVNASTIKHYEDALSSRYGEKATLYLQDDSIIDVMESAGDIDLIIQDPLSKRKISEGFKAKD